MLTTEQKHDVFHAIADPTRRALLQLLAEQELSIAALTEHVSVSRTAVNKHLHVLADAGLVMYRRSGRETRFRAEPEPLLQVKQWLSYFEQYWDEKLSALQQLFEPDRDSD